jgi:hypothetical protein
MSCYLGFLDGESVGRELTCYFAARQYGQLQKLRLSGFWLDSQAIVLWPARISILEGGSGKGEMLQSPLLYQLQPINPCSYYQLFSDLTNTHIHISILNS